MKFKIEFKNEHDLEQFKEFLYFEYMEARVKAYKYGMDKDSTLKDLILDIMQQLEAQGEDHD